MAPSSKKYRFLCGMSGTDTASGVLSSRWFRSLELCLQSSSRLFLAGGGHGTHIEVFTTLS